MNLDLCLLWQLVAVTPDRRQIYSKSKERPRIVGYKGYKWKGAAAKRQKARREGLHPSCNLLQIAPAETSGVCMHVCATVALSL